MFVRITRGRYSAGNEAEILRMVNEQLVPNILRQRPGFRSYHGGINREAGTLVAVSIWDTREQAEGLGSARSPFEALGVVFEPAETYEVLVSV